MRRYEARRREMVATQIAARGITDAAVLDAMSSVPREGFLPPELDEFAYQDAPLPIEEEQTISQPYIVALMIEALELRPGDRVLEVGTGSGYAAAVLGHVAEEVFTVERHRVLGELAQHRREALGLDNAPGRESRPPRGRNDHGRRAEPTRYGSSRSPWRRHRRDRR